MKANGLFRKAMLASLFWLLPAICYPQESNPNVFGIEVGNSWQFQGSDRGLSAEIVNPSFEGGTSGWGSGATSGADYTFSIATDPYAGAKAAMLTVRNDCYAMINNQTSIPITESGLYTLTLYAKVFGDVHHLSIAAWKASDPNTFPTTLVNYINPMVFSGEYELYQLPLNLEAGDYIRLELGIDNNASGTSYVLFDNLELGVPGGPYTLEKDVVRVDETSFPTATYVVEERVDGTTYGSWYEVLSGEVKLWGIQEGGSNDPQKFSSGLAAAWFPMAIGDQRVTEATTMVLGYTMNVRMTVEVVAREIVDVGFDSLESYKVSYQLRIWNSGLGYDVTESWYYWLVPYLANIKYQDSESVEVVSSFAISGGTITQETDNDQDGLKDYQELLYGPGWLAVDFGSFGLYHYYDIALKRINPGNPNALATYANKLAANFPDVGLYEYDGIQWAKLSSNSGQEGMCGTDTALYVDFGAGVGLYKYDGTWTRINKNSPENMRCVGTDVYADFGAGIGLYKYDGTWKLLTKSNPEDLCFAGSTVYADLGAGVGLYKYDGSTWSRINKMSPEAMSAVGSDLYVDFGAGVGLYKYNVTWARVSKSDPEGMLGVGTTLYIDFGTLGLYKHEGGVMTRIHKYNVEGMASYANKLVVNFPSVGLYEYNGSTWKKINPNAAEDMIAVDLY